MSRETSKAEQLLSILDQLEQISATELGPVDISLICKALRAVQEKMPENVTSGPDKAREVVEAEPERAASDPMPVLTTYEIGFWLGVKV